VEGTIHSTRRNPGLVGRLIMAATGAIVILGPMILGVSNTSEVRAQAAPGSLNDSSAMLTRARDTIAGAARRLPKCTCLETIERTYYTVPIEKANPRIMTEASVSACAVKEFARNKDLSLDARDRLRLSVTVAGGDEIYSWAAANRFDSRSVFQLVSTGPISTGSFGQYLVGVFENPGVRFRFDGTKNDGSGEVFEYAYEVPAEASHYDVVVGNGWKTTGYHGLFRIYAATGDLARLVVETDELPSQARLCRARTTIDYQYMLIGRGAFLIPRRSQLETLSPDAGETSSVTAFSNCHEYTAESTVSFDGQEPSGQEKTSTQTTVPLPPGLSLTLALLGPIDASVAAAGDPVSARVTNAVHAPHSDRILVPAGAIVHGRILQMRHQYSSSQFLVSIRFDTIETNGGVSPLSIEFARQLESTHTPTQSGLRQRSKEFALPAPGSGGAGGLFAAPTRSGGYVFPAGFKSEWTTVAQ
jgi:hypothetical protein